MKSAVILASAAFALALASGTAAAQTQPADSAAVAVAAAAPADSSHAAPAPITSRRRRSANVLTAEEIADAHVSSVYDAVSRLRPQWLRNPRRADIDPIDVQVYRNGQSLGNVDALKQISATDMATVQWLAPVMARGRYGPRAENGAIVLTDKT